MTAARIHTDGTNHDKGDTTRIVPLDGLREQLDAMAKDASETGTRMGRQFSNASDHLVIESITASQRMASNRAVIDAYRKNGEPRIVPLPADECDFDRNLGDDTSDLGRAIDQIREGAHLHVCRGCAAPLHQGRPCGSYCRLCSDEAAALHQLRDVADRRAVWAFCAGVVLCGAGILAAAKMGGWL